MTKQNMKAQGQAQWVRVFSLNASAPADATAGERELHEQRRALLSKFTAGGVK